MTKKWDIDKIKSQRVTNLSTLIAALEGKRLSAADMGSAIGLTKSGTARYVKDLIGANVIYCSGHSSEPRTHYPLYSLNRDKRIVTAFIERIEGVSEQRQAEKNRQTAERFQKARAIKIPAHTDLMQALFGMNRSSTC